MRSNRGALPYAAAAQADHVDGDEFYHVSIDDGDGDNLQAESSSINKIHAADAAAAIRNRSGLTSLSHEHRTAAVSRQLQQLSSAAAAARFGQSAAQNIMPSNQQQQQQQQQHYYLLAGAASSESQ